MVPVVVMVVLVVVVVVSVCVRESVCVSMLGWGNVCVWHPAHAALPLENPRKPFGNPSGSSSQTLPETPRKPLPGSVYVCVCVSVCVVGLCGLVWGGGNGGGG